jgi:protein O-GlcNAc transferase
MILRLGLVVALTGLLAASASGQTITPELKQAAEAGMAAKQSGNLDKAIEEFRKVVRLAPDLAAGHVNLGAVFFDKQDYANAVPALRRALELNPNLPGASIMLGTALLALGYPAEAIPHFEKTQTIDMLGIALVEAGREREGIDRLEAALADARNSNNPDLLYYLSQAHIKLAKQVAAKVLATAPADSPRRNLLLGESYAAAGQREAANKEFTQALANRPSLRGVHLRLGELALESGNIPEAEKQFAQEVAVSPGSAQAAYRYGAALLNKGDTTAALRELRRANTLTADMPETLIELGKAEVASNNIAEAEKALRRVVELEPESTLAETAHFQLSQIYRRTNRTADADHETKLFQSLRARRTRNNGK